MMEQLEMLGSIWLCRIWLHVLELLDIFGQFSPFYVCQKFNKSEEQYRKAKSIKKKFSTESEYFNGIQKVPQQNFGAYEHLMLE